MMVLVGTDLRRPPATIASPGAMPVREVDTASDPIALVVAQDADGDQPIRDRRAEVGKEFAEL